MDEILARWRPGEGTAWYLTDHLGTVRDLINATGGLINHIDYNTFGGILLQTDHAAGDRFLFTGRELDLEINLYFFRTRFYNSHLGLFLTVDPIGFLGGDPNLYRYLINSPLNGFDPIGLMAVERSFFHTRTLETLGELRTLLAKARALQKEFENLKALIDFGVSPNLLPGFIARLTALYNELVPVRMVGNILAAGLGLKKFIKPLPPLPFFPP